MCRQRCPTGLLANQERKTKCGPGTDSASSTFELMFAGLLGRWECWGFNLGLRLGSLELASLTPGYRMPPLRGSCAVDRADINVAPGCDCRNHLGLMN